jgi:hypothetical protein
VDAASPPVLHFPTPTTVCRRAVELTLVVGVASVSIPPRTVESYSKGVQTGDELVEVLLEKHRPVGADLVDPYYTSFYCCRYAGHSGVLQHLPRTLFLFVYRPACAPADTVLFYLV